MGLNLATTVILDQYLSFPPISSLAGHTYDMDPDSV